MSDARYRPHDLLKLRRCPVAAADTDTPPWVHDAFARAPFAVVRRARAVPGQVAVGLRGATRAERHATFADSQDIEALISPEHLLHRCPPEGRAMLAPFVLLRALQESACLVGWTWGPTGSTAFELATGVPTVHASSDLDVLVRAPAPVPADEAQALLHQFQSCAEAASIRVDVQLETPAGGVALAEWAMHKPRTLVKRADGPCLIADPWSAEFAHCGSDD